LISTLIIVGVLFLSSCGCIKETKEEPKEVFGDEKMKTLPAGWKWYVNETFGVRIGYPGDWKVKEDRDWGIDHISFKDEEWGDVFLISSEEIGEDFDLTDYARGTKEEQEKIIIGGKPGIKVSYEIRIGEREPCLNTWIYAIHKGRVFEFSFGEVEELKECTEVWYKELKECTEVCYKVLDTVQFF
jgi:hypothetical protein